MKLSIISFMLIFSGLFLPKVLYAQDMDSIPLKPVPLNTQPGEVFKDSARLAIEAMPRKAALRSAMLPGLGQIYNGRWWKVPLVYGGFVGIGLVFEFNQRYYKKFLKEAQYRQLNPTSTQDPQLRGFSTEGIIAIKDNYRRNRDLTILAGIGFYAINIIEAYVDAKFFSFDVSDDLSLQIKPSFEPGGMRNAFAFNPGVGFNIRFSHPKNKLEK